MLAGQLFRYTRGNPIGLAPANITAPTVAGIPTQGEQQTGTAGTWSAAISITHQWLLDDLTPISGATSLNFTPTVAEVGHSLILSETATNSFGSTTAFSLPTATIAANNPAVPVLAAVTAPIGRATKVGAGSVPLDSDTLGLLVSSGTSAVSGWQIRQTGGAAQWKTPAGVTIGGSFIATTGSPAPLSALTAGNTATFEVIATNASGPSNTAVLTHAVQSGSDPRPGYNISSQAELVAVCPTTGTFTNLNDAELWLARGAKYWETNQLLVRRVRCAAGHTGYIRPADVSHPPLISGGAAAPVLEPVKAQGCTNIVFQDLLTRKDKKNTYSYFVFPETTFSSQNVSFERCSFGAITQTDANTELPSGFSYTSTEGGDVNDCPGQWINGYATFSASGTTWLRCGDITIRRGFARHFRNNGIFRGGIIASHVIDNVNTEDCIYIAPTQQEPLLHMDGMQDTGSVNSGTVSNCYDDRAIVMLGEGVGVCQGRFGRTDNGNTHTNIGVRNPISTITAYWGFGFGVGNGRLAERGLFIFDPNAYTAGGAFRTNGYITLALATGRIGTTVSVSDPGWANVTIDNCLVQDYQPTLIPTAATVTNTTNFAGATLDSLTSWFNDPVGFDKAGVGWAAFTDYAAVKAEVIRCLKPVLNGPAKNGDGTYQGPLFPDGTWNTGATFP